MKIINNYSFPLVLYGIILFFALIPYYRNECLILGGEGNFILDFMAHFEKFNFSWYSEYNLGMPNIIMNGTGLNLLLLGLIEKMYENPFVPNFVLIFSIYFLPFFAMYLVNKEIKSTPFVSFVVSFCYVFNPFMFSYLFTLNQWCVFSTAIMPLYLWLIIKFYESNFKLFFFFGLISASFSFTFANPPTMVIMLISTIVSTIIASYYTTNKFLITVIFKKVGVLFTSFIVFNLWWILNFFVTAKYALEIFKPSFTKAFLETAVNVSKSLFAKMFFLIMIPENINYVFFEPWYKSLFVKVISLTPISIIVFWVLLFKKKKIDNFLIHMLLGMLLTSLFFIKGNAPPFGVIYNFLFNNVPLFRMFKSPGEKFGILYIFIFFVLLLFVLKEIKINYKKTYRIILSIFIAYLVICGIPIITGNIIPDYKLGTEYVTKRYKDKMEYKQLRNEINTDSVEYRILSLPGGANYQVCLNNYGGKYTGLDPVLLNTNKASISPNTGVNFLYNNISSAGYQKFFKLYNIGKVVINEDMIPWFGVVEKESVKKLKEIFNNRMPSKTFGPITLYDNKNYFSNRIYLSPSAE